MGDLAFLNFRNFMNESEGFLKALTRFMEREGIYGYEAEVKSILSGEPMKSVIEEIIEDFREKEGITVEDLDVTSMKRDKLLGRYLEMRGIEGYTGSILDLWGQYRKKGSTKKIKAKDSGLYHLKPSRDTLRIWCWENPDLKGVPELIPVKDLYGVDSFGQVDPRKYRYL
jgi:hypothetical protein